mmetsp:Transcript_25914/g.67995  ORF Transcript_25914/g.67995 Transcript_25914/m.67995 type:complete len:231 (-) Transcript_25914:3394-4086(-)
MVDRPQYTRQLARRQKCLPCPGVSATMSTWSNSVAGLASAMSPCRNVQREPHLRPLSFAETGGQRPAPPSACPTAVATWNDAAADVHLPQTMPHVVCPAGAAGKRGYQGVSGQLQPQSTHLQQLRSLSTPVVPWTVHTVECACARAEAPPRKPLPRAWVPAGAATSTRVRWTCPTHHVALVRGQICVGLRCHRCQSSVSADVGAQWRTAGNLETQQRIPVSHRHDLRCPS